ncbi:response regulator [Aquabacterium sp. A7-Y]|uniref:response regulator n=1 Tax=Aquabacterium sp. A7-Y TaxID=1349605 RepID=UPI00223D64DA|nr:response regulator [Aquabacterium sp. A7-Y]MCW7541409.1 response regulator [Aquabacterium sp. A7-Y]
MQQDRGNGSESREARALVLVVERDPHVRRLERFLLEEAGYMVQFSDDGLCAFDYARSTRPALVITEVLVPKCDGLALCRQLKGDEATRDIKVIIVSILACADRAREAGADAYVRKPLNGTLLIDSVRHLIGHSEGNAHAAHQHR